MKHTLTRAAAIAAAACLSTAALAACDVSSVDAGSSTGSSTGSADFSSSNGGKHDGEHKAGQCSPNEEYTEVPVNEALFGTDENQKTLSVAGGAVEIRAVYFQPGQMMKGTKMLDYDKSAAHLEVDTHITEAGATKYGYTTDETPSHLHIGYQIRKKGETTPVLTGELMEMNAGDGSHYGINIPVDVMKDGDYQIQFTVAPPKLNEYPLHKDNVTGVPANNWWKAEPTEWIDWAYKAPKKDAHPVEDCDVPQFQPVQTDTIPSGDPNKAAKLISKDGKPFGCEEPEIDIAQINAAPFTIGLAYFQPGGMLQQWLTAKGEVKPEASAMPLYQDSLAHLEADIHVVDDLSKGVIGDKGSDYGYKEAKTSGLDDNAKAEDRPETPSHLQVDYQILSKDGKTVIDSGKFMEMNADDGSHYGTNLKNNVPLVPGQQYIVKLTIDHPTEYALHIDHKTGVKVRHWFKKFSVETPWTYTGNQKACIVKPWQDAFPGLKAPAKK